MANILFYSLFLNFCFSIEIFHLKYYPRVKNYIIAKKNNTN